MRSSKIVNDRALDDATLADQSVVAGLFSGRYIQGL